MTFLSIRAVNNLYIFLEHGTIHKHKVSHEVFHAFCMALNRLEHALGEQTEDDYWQDFLRDMKYYRFLLNAVPLPMNTQHERLLPSIQEKLERCYLLFPGFVSYAQALSDKFTILIGLPDNPFIETIVKIAADHQIVGLLLKESFLYSLVEASFSQHPILKDIKLVNQHQLRGGDCFQQLIIIGPSYWYPEYILRAPRAKEIHLIRYGWLVDRWSPQPVFIKPFTPQPTRDPSKGNDHLAQDEKSDEPSIFDDAGQDMLPEINWKHISMRILRQAQEDLNVEDVPAKLYLLAREKAVFLDADENARAFVLDLGIDEDDEDEEGWHQIRRVSLSELISGMFLLLRTEGGGDYIVPIADRILGKKAAVLRAKQADWKARLRKAVEAKGIQGLLTISVELLDLGSKLANETNVRNWMSNRSIRPSGLSISN